MGTDIHMYAEVRKEGKWVLAEPLVRNEYFKVDSPYYGPEWIPQEVYEGRVYELFAILANVMNPIRSTKRYRFISKPRGLPSDVSPEILNYHSTFEDCAFSESWLLLEELENFDWHGKEMIKRGMVDPKLAHLFPPGRRGYPYDEMPEEFKIWGAANAGPGVEVYWIETYADAAGTYFFEVTLSQLRAYGSPKDVRIVFWFDA